MIYQNLVLLSFLFLLISAPLALGLVGPNKYLGIANTNTLTNPEVWYRANRFFGWTIIISCAVVLLAYALSTSLQVIDFKSQTTNAAMIFILPITCGYTFSRCYLAKL